MDKRKEIVENAFQINGPARDSDFDFDWNWKSSFVKKFLYLTDEEIDRLGLDNKMSRQFKRKMSAVRADIEAEEHNRLVDQRLADKFMEGNLELFRKFKEMSNRGDIDPYDYGLGADAKVEDLVTAFYNHAVNHNSNDKDEGEKEELYLPF